MDENMKNIPQTETGSQTGAFILVLYANVKHAFWEKRDRNFSRYFAYKIKF